MASPDSNRKIAKAKLITFAAVVGCAIILTSAAIVIPSLTSAGQKQEAPPAQPQGMLFLSAAIAVGLSVIAAGYAVAHVGAAAMGAVAEKPELIGRSLIYVGLAEGLAIYGLIIAIIILGKV